ncbi:hypothetical protein TRVA0_050S00936 [Trichomonascus vanleenenianus]|uniref:uncharacterized protein n=1 Tax=Trichomonascus vanleenenianus TaxID=2268995 RepID=UPI003ECAC1D4
MGVVGEIAQYFADPRLKAIELLPPGYTGLVFAEEEGVLGISQKLLKRTYAEIRPDYERLIHREDLRELEGLSLIAVIETTENLHAVNTRKRLVEEGLVTVEYELHLLDVLFSSPLKKHTKSPMLWQHRRWLLSEMGGVVDMDREMAIVYRAGELHPRNYYSWAYARWLIELTSIGDEFVEKVRHMAHRNVSDISMWAFYMDILVKGHVSAVEKAVESALELDRLAPGHETVGIFLRTLIARYELTQFVPELSKRDQKWVHMRLAQ